MNNQYCLDLDLGFVADHSFIQTLSIDDMPEYGFKQFRVEKSLIDSRVTSFLDSKGIGISHAEVFYTLPGKVIPIHVDTFAISNCCKLNFVYGATQSLMQWWKLKDSAAMPAVSVTPIGTEYLRFNKDDCDLVWQTTVGCPSLVNAGQPHSVLNCTDQTRKTLSLVLFDKKTQHLLKWDDAVEIFVLGNLSKTV